MIIPLVRVNGNPLVTMATIITGPFVLFEVRALADVTVSGVLYEARTSFVETVGPSVTWYQPLKRLSDFHEIRRRRSLHSVEQAHEFRENRLPDANVSGV